jgi:hypothetical protein
MEPSPRLRVCVSMRSRALVLFACVIGACAPSASGTPSGPCPVTTPPPVAVSPPPPAGTGPNPGLGFRASPPDFLYGNDALIVDLPRDATLHPSDPQRGLTGGIKFAWWRVAPGDLTITTHRLDGTTAPVAADVPSGYGPLGFQVSGLNFGAPGCWEVTGAIAGKTLVFVVNVAAQ